MKIRPPPLGKAKTTGQEKDLQPPTSVDVDSVSLNSNSSNLDPSRVTGLTSVSSPPATSVVAAAARATSPGGGVILESPTQQQGGAGGSNHPTKTRHLSESSYMTALSQDSVSSNGNEELSQESALSAPTKPRTSELPLPSSSRTTTTLSGKPKTAGKSSATIRGRLNYKVVKPVKMAESGGGGGSKGRKEVRSTEGITNKGNLHQHMAEANLTSSEMSNTEFESSTQCASDTGLSQHSDHVFSPSHTPVVNDYSLNTAGKESSNLTIKSSLPNGGFSTTSSAHNTGFTTGKTGFTAGYRPSRPPGYSNTPAGFSSHLEKLVSPNHQALTPAYVMTTGNSTEGNLYFLKNTSLL